MNKTTFIITIGIGVLALIGIYYARKNLKSSERIEKTTSWLSKKLNFNLILTGILTVITLGLWYKFRKK
ncbi:MAG: hypothetical protein KAU20_00825 [Nanoarchaeota archaeon]|nr:hypothetical protein [Nanoarchaeota archaeon]